MVLFPFYINVQIRECVFGFCNFHSNMLVNLKFQCLCVGPTNNNQSANEAPLISGVKLSVIFSLKASNKLIR